MIHFTIRPLAYTYTVKPKNKAKKSYLKTMQLIGAFYAAAGRSFGNPRTRRYVAWKKHIAATFRQQVPNVPLPFVWDIKERAGYVVTAAYFPHLRKFPDPENVRKAIIDSLAYVKGGGKDEWVGGWHEGPLMDQEDPRVEVWIFTADERIYVTDLVQVLSRSWVLVGTPYDRPGQHDLRELIDTGSVFT